MTTPQKVLKKWINEAISESLNEGGRERFDKLDQLREFMSDRDILEELIKYLPDHEWDEHFHTMMQYFSGDPDFGMDFSGYEDEEAMGMSGLGEAAKAKKTEHSGSKKGKGAYYGRKKDAKGESKKARREQDKKESKKGVNEATLRPDQIFKIANHLKKTGIIKRIADVRSFLADKANINISPDDAVRIHRLATESFKPNKTH